jgi:hypothetical protein
MTNGTPARILIGGCGLLLGALFVFALHGAALAGAVRYDAPHARVGVVAAAPTPARQEVAPRTLVACAAPAARGIH